MVRFQKMLRSVSVWRRVATERGAAGLAGAQVYPARAGFDALVTLVNAFGADSFHGEVGQMGAGSLIHGFIVCYRKDAAGGHCQRYQ